MAAWCPVRQGHETASVEFHFNLWRLPKLGWWRKFRSGSGDHDRDFIEVGILVDQPEQIEEICLFFPFSVARGDIIDCGPFFRDESIAEGIFNEQISVEIPAAKDGSYLELKTNGGTFCRVHKFEKSRGNISDNHLDVKPAGHGTLLTIKHIAVQAPFNVKALDGKTYFRLRVKLPQTSEGPFVQTIRPSDWALQSGFEGIELINFRLNEMRTLPSEVQNCLRRSENTNNAKVRLIAFLAAVPAVADMASSSTPSHKSRTLEHDIWGDYISNGLPDDIAIYHWKKSSNFKNGEEPISDFSAFVKLKQRRAGLGTIVVYLAIAFLFGVFGNVAASYIVPSQAVLLSSQSDDIAVQDPEAQAEKN
ncbi:hypothetical protein [Thioclava sp. F34-6]|uniref:hypothetical protein n=1 Tax=Thioclava sp. F34-6 TaxID=1973003 RepID=UPI0011BA9BAF|nr:hypothetical protein [Thioclava sp. F34-6]